MCRLNEARTFIHSLKSFPGIIQFKNTQVLLSHTQVQNMYTITLISLVRAKAKNTKTFFLNDRSLTKVVIKITCQQQTSKVITSTERCTVFLYFIHFIKNIIFNLWTFRL